MRQYLDLIELAEVLTLTGERDMAHLQAGIDRGWYPKPCGVRLAGVDGRGKKIWKQRWRYGEVTDALAALHKRLQGGTP